MTRQGRRVPVGRARRRSLAAGWFAACMLMVSSAALGGTLRVTTGGPALQTILDRAPPGAVVSVAPGHYRVHLTIDKPVTLRGEKGAILDGGGTGNVIDVRAPQVTIESLDIRNSGTNLTQMNAGIFVEQHSDHTTIVGNSLRHNLFGIWLDGGTRQVIADNQVRGITSLRLTDRGNGIHLHNVSYSRVVQNQVATTRDGIYIETSNNDLLEGNVMRDLRYGIHYMYSNHNRVIGNRSMRNHAGYALMQSDHLYVRGNIAIDDLSYGILMNYITYSTIAGNIVSRIQPERGDVTHGVSVAGAEGKAIFVYNCEFDTISDNRFADSDIGIHLTAGSTDNHIYRNAFLHNRTQVKYVSTRRQQWSFKGIGNYWSDYIGWDLNADGVGDKPYEPVDGVDRLLWRYPLAKILMNSPAIEILHWVQRQFPILRPQGVEDSHPLMNNLEDNT